MEKTKAYTHDTFKMSVSRFLRNTCSRRIFSLVVTLGNFSCITLISHVHVGTLKTDATTSMIFLNPCRASSRGLYATAEQELSSAVKAKQLAMVNLYRSLGGGWQTQPVKPSLQTLTDK